MPLIKRDAAAPPPTGPTGDDTGRLIEALRSADADVRWNAARALGGRADAVPALAAALDAEPVARVREAIMTALIRVGSEASAAALVPYLRSPDAARRGAAIEVLQALPQAAAPFMSALLGDDDSDVRILAIEVVRGMPAPEAVRLLCNVLEHEPHPNVCAAAVEVLAEVGTRDALPALQACARRFAGTPFLPFAISTAIARISDGES
jgi:HEAT repeat protein